MKTMTRDRWDELKRKARRARQMCFDGDAMDYEEMLACITPLEDRQESPDAALLRALGYVPGRFLNQRRHFYCPQCGPFASSDEDGICARCGSNVRDVNPGKDTP